MAVGPYEHFIVTADDGPWPYSLTVLQEDKVQYRYFEGAFQARQRTSGPGALRAMAERLYGPGLLGSNNHLRLRRKLGTGFGCCNFLTFAGKP